MVILSCHHCRRNALFLAISDLFVLLLEFPHLVVKNKVLGGHSLDRCHFVQGT